ncbi:GntR family transcriptional regulator [Lactococcus formosensis]|jgi:Transcriptional regulators|uniref:GntR family transcriptional regulator n=1 Tax=Lactococcus formosensis TaxID=1281486 RepID=UPI0030D1D3B9
MKGILYQEISNQLKHDIITGKYPLNSLFPTENELVEMFSVSKITIRKAIELLVQEGYLHKQSGKGTTIISNRPFNILNNAIPFTRLLEKDGINVKSKIIEVKESSMTEHTFAWPYVYEITRVYSLNDVPTIYSKHYFALKEKETLEILSDENFSLYRLLYDKSLPISQIKDTFRAIKIDESLKQYVNFSEDFALQRNRFSFDPNGGLIEFTKFIYDSERQEYYIDYLV